MLVTDGETIGNNACSQPTPRELKILCSTPSELWVGVAVILPPIALGATHIQVLWTCERWSG